MTDSREATWDEGAIHAFTGYTGKFDATLSNVLAGNPYRAGHVAPLPNQVLQIVPNIGEYTEADETYNTDRHDTTELEAATVITSRITASDLHQTVLDIDLPAQLIPSTTPGHFHLYIDKPMTWRAYLHLLEALANAGLIEKGYLEASRERGFTAVRLPWVKKEPPNTQPAAWDDEV